MADALGVSTDYLLGRCDDPERDGRAVRRNSAIRAVRVLMTAAAERVVHAIESDDRVIGAGIGDIRALLEAANACAAHANGASGTNGASLRLTDALDRLETAALKVGIAVRRYDNEISKQRERLAEIAANDAR